MFSLTRSEFRLTLVFTAVIWFISVFEGNYPLALILIWATIIYWKRWHQAHPGEAVFEDPIPAKKEAPKAPAHSEDPEKPVESPDA